MVAIGRISRQGRLALAAVTVFAIAAVATTLWRVVGASPNGGVRPAAGRVAGGKLAYSGSADVPYLGVPADLFVINADGSGRQRLTHCEEERGPSTRSGRAQMGLLPFADCIVRTFAWSPDGSGLAFVRGIPGGRNSGPDMSLFVIGADGRGERRLEGCGKPRWPSCGDFFGSQLAWEPGGSRLVVPREGALFLIDVNGSGFRRLSPDCGSRKCFDMHPAWSPDGSKIVFARQVAARSQALYSIRPDGSGMTRLTYLPGQAGNPAWSPDGRSIAFDFWDESHSRLYVMAVDGSGMRVLRSGPNGSGPGVPAWSPDGTKIAYLVTPRAGTAFSAEIWVIQPNGSGRRRLYRSEYGLATWGRPAWSPNAKLVAFSVGIVGKPRESGIFVVSADKGAVRSDFPPVVTDVTWRPRQ